MSMDSSHPTTAIFALEHSLDDALTAAGGELWRCVDNELSDLVERTHRLLGRIRALHLAAVAEFDERGIAEATGALNTRAWLRHRLNETHAAAGATVKMAGVCSQKSAHAPVGQCLAAGTVGWDQARVIVQALEKLPESTGLEQREFGRDLLLQHAAELNADDLRTLGRALHEAADPDGKLKDDDAVERVRGAHYRDHHDGTHSLTWRDSVENLALAKAAIGALDTPKPQENGSPDSRAGHHRRADALVEIFTGLLGRGDLPAARGERPHLHLTVGLAALKGAIGAAKAALATGSALTPEAVRRLACDAEITPIVLDPAGMPLSVGRKYRSVTAAIWAALLARDTGCAFPACTAPASHCRGHHIRHWADGGDTSLQNTVLVCEPHHVMVHHRGWQVRIAEDGLPEFIPPPWATLTGQDPRRNHHWRLQRDLLDAPPPVPEE